MCAFFDIAQESIVYLVWALLVREKLRLSPVPWLQIRHQPHLVREIQDSQEVCLIMKHNEPKLTNNQHCSSS